MTYRGPVGRDLLYHFHRHRFKENQCIKQLKKLTTLTSR